MFKKLAATLAMAMCLVGPSITSAAQQVSPDTYREGTKKPFYGRSDGIYWHKTYKSPRLIGNGDGFSPLGPTYFETFTYGDGLGILCEGVAQLGTTGYSVAASANAACNTTCGNNACMFGLEAALADAGDLLTCADATADACVCQTTSLDHVLLGCGTAWEAPALGISLVSTASGTKLAHVALLAQDIGPDMDADGLDIAGDQTDNDGAEVLAGMYGASGRPMYPNVDPAFEFCADIKVTDLSGTDELWLGWRDTTAPNATLASYNSYAIIGVDATAGDWMSATEDDGGGTTTTDLTLPALVEDTATELCVKVSDTGVATYTINNELATDAVAYTFDAGEPIVPFVHFLHASDVADEVLISEWRVSYQ